MKRHFVVALDDLFQQKEAKESARKRELAAKQQAREAYVAEFWALADSVITPALDELGRYLRERGHEFRLEVSGRNSAGTSFANAVTFSVRLVSSGDPHVVMFQIPTLAFVCDAEQKAVRIKASLEDKGLQHLTRSKAVKIEGVDANFVHGEFAWLAKVSLNQER